MRPFSSLSLLAVFAASANVALAVTCGQGTYRDTSTNICQYCQPGTYSNANSPPNNFCTNASKGHLACGPRTVGGQPCYGATAQSNCGPGKYSATTGMSTCTDCPAGYQCDTPTTETPKACTPGHFQATTGGGADGCAECPKGQYNNGYAAKSCCNCCAGTYQNDKGKRSCKECSDSKPYSPIGATSPSQCSSSPIAGVVRNTSCKNTIPANGFPAGQGYCFPEQGSGPANTGAIYNKRRGLRCAKGLKRCPHFSGKGGFDCVDIRSDPESCGGCVSYDGGDTDGVDCTSIPNVSVTRCVKGKCVIKTCARRYTLSDDGKSCELADYQSLQSQRRKRHAGSLHAPVSHRHVDV